MDTPEYTPEVSALVDVCGSLGIRVVPRTDREDWGVWMWKDQEIHMSWPAPYPAVTLAHELGHALTLDKKPESFAGEYMNMINSKANIFTLNDQQRRTVLKAEIRAWRVGMQVLRVVRQHLGIKLTPEQVKTERTHRTFCINSYRSTMRVPSIRDRRQSQLAREAMIFGWSATNVIIKYDIGMPPPTFAPSTFTYKFNTGPIVPILVSE